MNKEAPDLQTALIEFYSIAAGIITREEEQIDQIDLISEKPAETLMSPCDMDGAIAWE